MTLVRRYAVKRNAGRRREAGGAAVAQFVGAFHVPMDFVLRYAEVVLQNAACPERRGLLIFADADALAVQIARAP